MKLITVAVSILTDSLSHILKTEFSSLNLFTGELMTLVKPENLRQIKKSFYMSKLVPQIKSSFLKLTRFYMLQAIFYSDKLNRPTVKWRKV